MHARSRAAARLGVPRRASLAARAAPGRHDRAGVACRLGPASIAAPAAAAAGRYRRPQATLERFEGVEPHMGTLVSITVFAPDAAAARVALRAGFDRIRELNAILSDYLPDSELSRVTRDAVGRPVPLSADLFAVLKASQAPVERHRRRVRRHPGAGHPPVARGAQGEATARRRCLARGGERAAATRTCSSTRNVARWRSTSPACNSTSARSARAMRPARRSPPSPVPAFAARSSR